MLPRLCLLACLLLLGACATDPRKLFDSSIRNAQSPLATSLADAIAQAPIETLPVDPRRQPRFEISEQHPRVLLHGLPSNYRVFRIRLEEGKLYNLQVHSSCVSCSGHARYGLKPAVFLLDDHQQVVDERPSHAEAGPRGVSLRLSGYAQRTGDYYLLVAADNRTLGYEIVLDQGSVGQPYILSPNTLGIRRPSPMRSYPIGEVRVFASTRR